MALGTPMTAAPHLNRPNAEPPSLPRIVFGNWTFVPRRLAMGGPVLYTAGLYTGLRRVRNLKNNGRVPDLDKDWNADDESADQET
ncbi:MAG TPA: hypothetical protein VHY37_03535, partial [Tepidisphaeraceae bacterium]|nr:hypothetical protein [Tepidisphaeraceae bacterium]